MGAFAQLTYLSLAVETLGLYHLLVGSSHREPVAGRLVTWHSTPELAYDWQEAPYSRLRVWRWPDVEDLEQGVIGGNQMLEEQP